MAKINRKLKNAEAKLESAKLFLEDVKDKLREAQFRFDAAMCEIEIKGSFFQNLGAGRKKKNEYLNMLNADGECSLIGSGLSYSIDHAAATAGDVDTLKKTIVEAEAGVVKYRELVKKLK